MIYGMNFNRTPIPPAIKRKFAKRVRMTKPGQKPVVWAELAGVAQSLAERNEMIIQANNGHRKLHVEVRQTAAGPWYGIYVHHGPSLMSEEHYHLVAEADEALRKEIEETIKKIERKEA